MTIFIHFNIVDQGEGRETSSLSVSPWIKKEANEI